jgi:segregation and condensation protein B
MTAGRPNDPPPNLSGEWLLDAEPALELAEDPGELDSTRGANAPRSPQIQQGADAPRSPAADVPPSPEQIIEAMLFVGGHPLTADAACSAIRGLTAERFLAGVDVLVRRYREQRRPYSVVPRGEGFVLALLPAHRGLRERLFGGPREARLSQAAVDVLSVVAYRQPVGKAEIDAIRGTDSGSILRQLVRLGMVAVQHRAEAGSREVRYGTTPRFLRVFGLASLDELPRMGDTSQV